MSGIPVWGFISDSNGNPVTQARIVSKKKGTSTDQALYTDEALTTPAANPYDVNDSAGAFALYRNPLWDYDIQIKTSDEATTLNSFSISASEASTAIVQTITTQKTTPGDDSGDTVTRLGRDTAYDGFAGVYGWATGDQSSNVSEDEFTSGEGDGDEWVAPTSDKTGASGAYRKVFRDSVRFDPGISGNSLVMANQAALINAPWVFETAPGFVNQRDARAKMGIGVGGTVQGGNTWSSLQVFDAGATVNADGTGGSFELESTLDQVLGPTLLFSHESAGPAGNDIVGLVNFRGKDSAANNQSYSDIRGTIQTATSGAEYGQIQFYATNNGSALLQMQIGEGIVGQGATGGFKGRGTINAQAVYDDNTLLTCYVFDAAVDGEINLAKWDALVPDREYVEETYIQKEDEEDGNEVVVTRPAYTEPRQHIFARKFAERMGTEYDPLTIEGYTKHWLDKKHLTSMPNERGFDPVNSQLTTGEWIQRLVETVEIQAVLLAKMNERIKLLEGGHGS